MTAARCRCSHTNSNHSKSTGHCWSTACGCGTFRPRERTHEQDNREDLRRADEFRSPPTTTSTGLLPAGYEPDLGDAS